MSEEVRLPSHSFRLRRQKGRDAMPAWRSPASEARFRKIEDVMWQRMPRQPDRVIEASTSFGSTRAYFWSGKGYPVVLLHGMGTSSVIWQPFISELDGRTIVAIDTLGDVGRGTQTARIGDADESAAWLAQTFDALDVGRAHVVGLSYGGFLAVNLAIHEPERVRSLALLEPAGLATLQMGRLALMGLRTVGAMVLPVPLRCRAARRLGMPMLLDRKVMRMGAIGQMHHPFNLPQQVALDSELRALQVPTLLLLGERSEIHRAHEVLERAMACMPSVDGEILKGVGHSLPVDPRAEAPRRVRDFLDRVDRNGAFPAVS